MMYDIVHIGLGSVCERGKLPTLLSPCMYVYIRG